MQIKIHEAYRIIVSICDSGLIGKKFEEGDKQLDLKESFYAGEEVDEKKAVEILVDMKKEDATFNIVGKESVRTAEKSGIIKKGCFDFINGISYTFSFL